MRVDEPFTDEQFNAALAVLEEQVDSGQVKQVKGNSYKEDLINEQAWAAMGWSGDIFQINAEEGDKWEFALPDTGGTLWSDNLLIPKSASNQTGAEALMDFYYRPDIAAQVAAYVNYVCPVQGARRDAEDRPGAGQERVDLPDRRDPQQLPGLPATHPEEQVATPRPSGE